MKKALLFSIIIARSIYVNTQHIVKNFRKAALLFFVITASIHANAQYAAKSFVEVGYNLLSVDSFDYKISNEKNIQIIDTRLPEEYVINHLINAVNINNEQQDYETKIAGLNKENPVFTYAIGNGRSVQLAKELTKKGFKKIYVLDGGIGGWIGNAKPIYSSVKDNFTINDFKKITASNKLVLLDLHTRYCPGCRKLQPTVDSLSNEYGTALKVVKVDIYDNPAIAGTFKVNAVPTLIVYENDKIIWQKTGSDIHKSDVDFVLPRGLEK